MTTKPDAKPLKPSQLAERCGVHKNTVHGWINQGRVSATRTPTGRILIDAAEGQRVVDSLKPRTIANVKPSPRKGLVRLDSAESWSVDGFPWFPAYPTNWLLSKSVRLMTYEQRGIYWELLCMAWRDQGIPADLEDLAALLGCPLGVLKEAWRRIGPLFERKEGEPSTLVNRWQEEIRAEQLTRFARASAKGTAAVAARRRSERRKNRP